MRRSCPEVFLVLMLAAGVAGAATEKTRVIVLEIAVLDTSAPGPEADAIKRLAQIAGEQVSSELGSGQFEVLSSGDLELVLGLERQKQLLGCGESSCLAELSGALGAPLLVSGSLSRAGGKMRLDLKLVRTKDARVLARQGSFLENEGDVFTAVPPMVRALADAAEGREPVKVTLHPGPSRSIPALVAAGLGVAAALGGGGVLIHQSLETQSLGSELEGGGLLLADAERRRSAIYTERAIGLTLVGTGAAVAVGGVVWFLLSGGAAKSSAALVPVDQGALLSWEASW